MGSIALPQNFAEEAGEISDHFRSELDGLIGKWKKLFEEMYK